MRSVTGLRERVAHTIERYRMVSPGQTVGVAVSGGADSVCLLHVLRELEYRIAVLHLNHGLRGAESDEDEAFVAGMAGQLGLPMIARRVNLEDRGGNLEESARAARQAFYAEAIAQGKVDCVAVGHTRSDQAETVLFRLLRGAGTAGLAGIRPVTRESIIRPLLEVHRSETEQYLRDRDVVWRTDSTNASARFARNRIRRNLLPQLEREWNPQLADGLANMADWAQAEETYWESEIDRLATGALVEREGSILVRVSRLTDLPLAVARRLVRRAIQCAKGDTRAIEFDHVERILKIALATAGTGRVQVPGLDIVRSFDWMRFTIAGAHRPEPGYKVEITVPGAVQLPGMKSAVYLELIEKSETSGSERCVYNSDVGCLDWGSLSGRLVFRNWHPGDQYQPIGKTGPIKVKTLFQQARIPLWERGRWPILIHNGSIGWVRGFGAAAGLAAHAGSKVILRIREDSL